VIQNPGVAVAQVIVGPPGLTPPEIISNYGGKIAQGAFVSVAEFNAYNLPTGGGVFVADRIDDHLYLQDNSGLAEREEGPTIDAIGEVINSGYAPLDAPPEQLETFTVFGLNDDGEAFTAIVAATEDTIETVGRTAGATSWGGAADVELQLIVKGDASGWERVTV
jgi:hypothetical protein